jgi:hypothetical protein
MKSINKIVALAAIALISAQTSLAQPTVKLSQKYLLRETAAPASIKNLLATQRNLITAQKLEFNLPPQAPNNLICWQEKKKCPKMK